MVLDGREDGLHTGRMESDVSWDKGGEGGWWYRGPDGR